MTDFIRSLVPDLELVENCRSVIGPREIDCYLPKLALGFEFNGLYWHDKLGWEQDVANSTYLTREAQKDKMCADKGVLLVHVWEDAWDDELDNIRVRDEIARTIEARRSSAALNEERIK